MSDWREPITDRTLQDVKNVDVGSLEYQKGALNADDLNRIEGNFAYLEEKLRGDAIFIPHIFRNYEETVLEYVEKKEMILPDGYTQVEYIQSSGTQHIDWGFKPTQNTKVELDIEFLGSVGENIAGVRNTTSDTTNRFGLITFGSASKMGAFFRDSSIQGIPFDNKRHKYVLSKPGLTIDGTIYAFSNSGTFLCSYNFLLCAWNNGSDGVSANKSKVYGGKAWENGTLIRDSIPCKNSSGTVGLYDLVSSKFYTNAGSGIFAAGAEIEKTEPETSYELVEIKTIYTDWQEHNLPWLSEINRIRANYNALVRLFLVGLGLPVLAESNYLDWQEVNDWERIADVGKEMFENMEKEYRYCGIEVCGGERLL